jgi:hypothetical protein
MSHHYIDQEFDVRLPALKSPSIALVLSRGVGMRMAKRRLRRLIGPSETTPK